MTIFTFWVKIHNIQIIVLDTKSILFLFPYIHLLFVGHVPKDVVKEQLA